jgi:hypothetical protein
MSDVRDQLAEHLNRLSTVDAGAGEITADAILERFDVIEKPVVTSDELGRMLIHAFMWGDDTAIRGQRMLDLLTVAGLRIVKADDQ